MLANLESLQQKNKKILYPNLIKQKCLDEPLILKDIARTYSDLALFSKSKSLACISKDQNLIAKDAFNSVYGKALDLNLSDHNCLESDEPDNKRNAHYSNVTTLNGVRHCDHLAKHRDVIEAAQVTAGKQDQISYNCTPNLENNISYLVKENATKASSTKNQETDLIKRFNGCDNYIEKAEKDKLNEPKFKSNCEFLEKRNLETNIKFEGDFFDYDLGQNRLQRVLRAYANFDGEVGYTQGMNFIVAGLIYCLNPNNDKESVDGKE